MAFYNVCPRCGAHLDPGERCSCREEEKEGWRIFRDMVKEEADGQYAFRWAKPSCGK